MSVAYDTFFDYVLTDAPSCSQRLARDRIRQAAIQFCERTKAYRFNVSMNIVPSQSDYVVVVPSGTVLSSVISLWYSDQYSLDPKSVAWIQLNVPLWHTPGQTKYYYLTNMDDNIITLVQAPTESITNGLVIEAALKPTFASTTVPDFLLNKYHEEIAHGALGKILSIPKKPWTDFELARYHMVKFNSAITAFGGNASRNGTRVAMTTRPDY